MPKTLLLADDSVTIQKVVGISFANEDIKLVTVDNGDDALARAREVAPDIVLADVVMPGMNGYEVCEAIKSDPALRHVPVLLLTGTFEAYDEERARRAGADGHVTKPFEAQALVDLVNARLAEAASAGPAPAPAAPEPAMEPESAPAEVDLFEDVTAPSGTAPAGAAPAPDPAGSTRVLTDEERFGGAEDDDAFAFDAPDEIHDELSVSEGPSAPPEPAPAGHDATVALYEDDDAFANAETLPPVDADPEPGEVDPFGATRIVEEPFAAPGAAASEPSPFEAEPPALARPGAGDPLGAAGPPDLAEASDEPFGASDYDVSSSDLGEALSGFPTEPAPAPPSTASPSARGAGEALPAGATSSGDAPASDLSPVFRQQIQDALEKVAWEAFGDLAEKLVKDALERVERVAWEVVPQMAETLIQEEIRRLQREED